MTQKSAPAEKCPLIPLSGYIVLEPLELKPSSSGFIVADQAKSMESAGVVRAIGEKYPHPTREGLFVESEVKVGDGVVFRRFGNEPFLHAGKNYYHIKFTDLLSIINDE